MSDTIFHMGYMPLKRQLTYLKEVRKLAKLRKIEDKSETLVENKYFSLEDESIEDSWVLKNNISYYKDFDYEENSDFEDNMEMIDNDEEVLDIDTFNKLLKAT